MKLHGHVNTLVCVRALYVDHEDNYFILLSLNKVTINRNNSPNTDPGSYLISGSYIGAHTRGNIFFFKDPEVKRSLRLLICGMIGIKMYDRIGSHDTLNGHVMNPRVWKGHQRRQKQTGG